MHYLLTWFSLPQEGLYAVFLVCFISATILPLSSEPTLFAYIKLNPDMFWIAILVATIGNTLSSMINWMIGYGAVYTHNKIKGNIHKNRIMLLFKYFGSSTLLLSWLPIIGDILCIIAGWLKLPWWSCMMYMAIGKFFRYVAATYFLMLIPNNFWSYLTKNIALFCSSILCYFST